MTKLWDSFQNFVDKLFINVASREFQVFAAACFLLYKGILDVGNWVIIAVAYMGLRSFQKVKEKEIAVKNGNNGTTTPG